MLNAIRTTVLIAALTGVFMAVGLVVGGRSGMFIALGIALVTNVFAYWNADKLILRMQNARELSPRTAPDLFRMVEALSDRAGIPMPRLYLLETDQPNAFATGRNPENAAVAVSSGLLRTLDQREVAAVVAHELAHIRSRDTLVMTVTGTLAGAISMLAQFGLFFGGRSSNSPLGPLGTIATVLIAPIAAILVQMAVSRTREYEADRDGAMISGDPLALASALSKISSMAKNFENKWARRSPGMAHLFIINPLADRPGDNLFATHPDVRNRIAELQKLAQEMRRTEPVMDDLGPRRPTPRRSFGTARSGWRVPQTGAGDAPSSRRPGGPWG